MFEEIRDYIEEIELILKEIDRYKAFKKFFLSDLKTLNEQYANKQFGYETYKKLKEKLLEGKTKKDQIENFNATILSLVRKLEYINTQIFSIVYAENVSERIFQKKSKPKKVVISKLKGLGKIPEKIEDEKPAKKPVEIKAGKEYEVKTEIAEAIAPPSAKTIEAEPVKAAEEKGEVKTLTSEKAIEVSDVGEAVEITGKYGKAPKPLPRKKRRAPRPKKKSFGKILKDAVIGKKEEDMLKTGAKKFGFGGILSFGFIRDLFRRIREKEKVIGKDTVIGGSLLDFSEVGHIDFEEESRINPNLLVKQASQLKELLKSRHIKMHAPNMVGTLANISVRRFSIYLIDQFPDFFKRFYLTLRYANTKVLSNTYVNIMVFFSMISSFIFAFVSILFSLAQKSPIFLIVSKAFLMGLLGAGICAGFMIYYPNMKIKDRIKSINTNIPFAIDHMSSLVASGVPPATMFRLLSQSKEYGEVSLEIQKISNFIDVFGYDLLTSLKSVAATTPAPILKEFIDGLTSTIESGGSLKNYLVQKSKEAMLAYRLERQKYVESISTYSDIYTGVLIAAPLFFVSALSLVSILGGRIGGYDVDTVISFGTYVLIPVLNVMFILFLEMNQPEV